MRGRMTLPTLRPLPNRRIMYAGCLWSLVSALSLSRAHARALTAPSPPALLRIHPALLKLSCVCVCSACSARSPACAAERRARRDDEPRAHAAQKRPGLRLLMTPRRTRVTKASPRQQPYSPSAFDERTHTQSSKRDPVREVRASRGSVPVRGGMYGPRDEREACDWGRALQSKVGADTRSPILYDRCRAGARRAPRGRNNCGLRRTGCVL